MVMKGVWGSCIALILSLACATLAAAPAGAASTDSEAPANAPAHWLPPEAWVYNHWLPYDEGRLYRLARITRWQLWQHLRDDRRTVAQLVARRGWRDPRRLAAALVAPRARVVGPRRLRLLHGRALRTLTQGHLAQHVFFHSLHQFAIPSAAPEIFGVPDVTFRALRRSELSPLDIGRLHGHSPSRVQAESAAVLRDRIRAGVRGHAMTARQGALLLRRQLSQLPRWLGQERYNGPPQTHAGQLIAKPRNYASSPVLSADGQHVAFEAYEQKLPLALQRGEISVISHDLGTGADLLATPAIRACSAPSSSYNPSISGDGRYVAFECSEGNRNFAKRYGKIQVFVRDTVAGTTELVEAPGGARSGVSLSSYNPAISADGTTLAFEAVRSSGRTAVVVRNLRTGATETASAGLRGDFYEPSISADGRVVAFTSVPSAGTPSQVHVRDLAGGVTLLASGTEGGAADDFASNPSVSADGRLVAFTAGARNGAGRSRAAADMAIHLRDLAAGQTRVVSRRRDRMALDPAISGDGRRVVYTAVVRGESRVYASDLATGTAQLVSRAGGSGGAGADGHALDPSISGDGMRVAFASIATNLDPRKPDTTRGVFVRDLGAHTTTLASAPSGSR